MVPQTLLFPHFLQVLKARKRGEAGKEGNGKEETEKGREAEGVDARRGEGGVRMCGVRVCQSVTGDCVECVFVFLLSVEFLSVC